MNMTFNLESNSPEIVVRNSIIGVMQTDIAGSACRADSRWREITGLTDVSLSIDLILKSIHPEDADKVKNDWWILKRIARPIYREFRFVRPSPSGEIVWVQSQIVPIISTNDNVTGYIETLMDITDSMCAEEALRKINMKLKNSIEKMKTLSGLLPICSSCKKIRDNVGAWHRIETYICKHTDADFTHGICPDCAKNMLDSDQD